MFTVSPRRAWTTIAIIIIAILIALRLLQAPRQRASAPPLPPTVMISCSAASVVPRVVRPGDRATFSATVTPGVAPSIALVSFEVYDAMGSKVGQTYAQVAPFSDGVARSIAATWSVPSTLGSGTYTLKVLVFGPNWSPLYAFSYGCATFEIGSPGAEATVVVDRSQVEGVSGLNVGTTYEQNTLDPWDNTAAARRGAALLAVGVAYRNQHIYGWGATNPEPSPGVYDWASLDRRMDAIHALGGTPVITLCCAPDWMTSLGTNTSNYPNLPPTAQHIADFANLAASIARRYPWVTHVQVWNEMKGYWSPTMGNWDYVAYTAMYNAVYDALKGVNPAIQVGGPYLSIEGTGEPISDRNLAVLRYWLAHKHGADFICIDHSIVDYNATSAPSRDTILAQTVQFEDITRQLRALTGLPIWWSEDYFDANLGRLSYADGDFQAAVLASMTYHELIVGASVTLRWQPQGVASEPYQGDQASLFTDARSPGGGQPTPYYYAFKAFHDVFTPGAPLWRTRSSDPSIEALATADKTLLINKHASPAVVRVEATGAQPIVVTLPRYGVALV